MKSLNKMTAEELINYCTPVHDIAAEDIYTVTLALRNKLKEAITPNPDEIHIVWSVEDVYAIAKEDSFAPTLEQAREVLKRCKKHHDACFGVSWETISDRLTDVMTGK